MSDSIVYVSTYIPRKCGIATFTQDLSESVSKVSFFNSKIVALNDNGNNYNYPKEVFDQIRDKDVESYQKVATRINQDDDIKLVSVQHEFKIFGCEHGKKLLVFLKAIDKPVITTFHTVLPAPSELRKDIVQEIVKHSEYIVVMSNAAVKILKKDYSLPQEKIVIIPHGIHDLPYRKTTLCKEKLDYQNRLVLSSFGLLRPGDSRNSSGKGYEFVLDALPKVVKKFPNLLYLIIGQTHPKTLKLEGERYRDFLKEKVKKLGLERNVKFVNEFVTLNELFAYLQATDIYVCSPLNKNQVCSGTLVYAMGCGRAVVSTPFLHAQDIVSSKTGILTKFRNSQSFSEAMIQLLDNPGLMEKMGQNAYAYTRKMVWENVALSYSDLFNQALPLEISTPEMIHVKAKVPVRLYKFLSKKERK